jgi:DNA polymerase-3 subunit gamma/tau
VIRTLKEGALPAAAAPAPAAGASGKAPTGQAPVLQAIGGGGRAATAAAMRPDEAPAPEPDPAQAMVADPSPEPPPWEDDGAVTAHDPATFQAVIDLADALREGRLFAALRNNLHLVHFEPGRIEFRPGEKAPADLAHVLTRFLNTHTVRRWVVTVSREAGAPTLQQQAATDAEAANARAAGHPLVKSVMEVFPGASIAAVRSLAPPPEKLGGDTEDDAPPPMGDDIPDEV